MELGLVFLQRVVVVQRLLQFVVDLWRGRGGVFGGKVGLVRRGGNGQRRVVLLTVHRFDPLHLGPKTVFVVGRVLDHPGRAVRFDQAVRALDRPVTVTHLILALLVAGQRVVHRVLKVIRRPWLVWAVTHILAVHRGRGVVVLLLRVVHIVIVQLERRRRGYGACGQDEHCDEVRKLKKCDKINIITIML